MANYPTSCHKKPGSKLRRFCVTYEEQDPGDAIFTFGVNAYSMSEATALTISFIDTHRLNPFEYDYTLSPKISDEITDYNIKHETTRNI